MINNGLKLKKKYTMLALIFAGLGIFCIMTGSSYAYFTTQVTTKDYAVYTGSLAVNYSRDGSLINLSNTIPKTNAEGLATEGYKFTITNTGTITARYQIRLELDKSNEIPIDCIKLAYVKTKSNSVSVVEASEPVLLSNLNGTLTFVSNQVLEPTKQDSYILRLWLDYSASNDAQGKSFKASIAVDAIQNVDDGYVVGDQAPTITLNKYSDGSIDSHILVGETFTDPGVLSIKDDHDTLTPSDVKTTYEYTNGEANLTSVNSVDTATAGVYYINYEVKDSSGNVAKVVRVVTVNSNTPPTITLNGESTITINQNNTYEELGATSTGNQVVTIGYVNTKAIGTYIIRYIAIDANGFLNSVVRTVNVISIPDPVSFATDSWSTIIANVRAGNTSVYAPTANGRENQVLREVDLGTLGTHYLRVANTTPCTNGEISETACGFVIEFADVVMTGIQMNLDCTNLYGYGSSDGISYVQDVYNALPQEIKDTVIPTNVVSSHGNAPGDDANRTTKNQYLYLLGYSEVYDSTGAHYSYDTAATTTRMLDYYRLNNTDSNRVKKYQGDNGYWWLRTSSAVDPSDYLYVSYEGDSDTNSADETNGISPAFRIG